MYSLIATLMLGKCIGISGVKSFASTNNPKIFTNFSDSWEGTKYSYPRESRCCV